MSRSCHAIQLVVFDADALQEESVACAIRAVVDAGMRLGTISSQPDIARRVDASQYAHEFDIWLPGVDGVYPFERLTALVDIEPARVLFVSRNPGAEDHAQRHGMATVNPETDDINRFLT